MCDPRMESTFNNRPPSVFSLILNPQNFTETLQIEIRDIMIALPLKTSHAMYLVHCLVYAQNHCFIRGHIILRCKKLSAGSARCLYHFWPETRPDCAASLPS